MRAAGAREARATSREEPAGAQWRVELTAAANYFAMLSGIVNAFEVEPPPDGDRLPA